MEWASVKTRTETGFQAVLTATAPLTPYGKMRLRDLKPFAPGDEGRLEKELDRLEAVAALADQFEGETQEVLRIFAEVKDTTFSIRRSGQDVLSVVELYEIKVFLLQCEMLSRMFEKLGSRLPGDYLLIDTGNLLDLLDPEQNRVATFYIYDCFSEKLTALRKQKRELERSRRKELRQVRDRLRREYGLSLTPKFDLAISRMDKSDLALAESIPELYVAAEDYMSITFAIRQSRTGADLQRRLEALEEEIEAEELRIQKHLSSEIYSRSAELLQNMRRIGDLDFVLAKAYYARKHRCVRPRIVRRHMLQISDGRFLPVEAVLAERGRAYCPVSIRLEDGVTCITGANMGGKTVSMKLCGLVSMLAQCGFFVPCGEAVVGLSSSVHMLVGDSQDIQKGLSSFGSEMEGLKEILAESRERALIFIDEIAGSTNPVEGYALTKSLVKWMADKPFITLLTTHFDHVAEVEGVINLQVRGLADADFSKLADALRAAAPGARVDVIAGYMDYRLQPASQNAAIPKDALNIAEMLGLEQEIIKEAKRILEEQE